MREQDYGWTMYMRGPLSDKWDLEKYDVAHRLLRIIVKRINWRGPNPQEHSGLGEALINPVIAGMPRRTYQNALKKLIKAKQVELGAVQPKVGVGTIVKLTEESIYQVKIVTESASSGACSGVTTPEMQCKSGASSGASSKEEKPAPTGSSEHRNGKSSMQVPMQDQCNTPKNTMQPEMQPAMHILKNPLRGKEIKEKTSTSGAASPPLVGGALPIVVPEVPDPTECARELAREYPKMMEIMCGEFCTLTSSGFEAAVGFFELCSRNWSATDICYVGMKGLIESGHPPGPGDRFWWCRKYAKDISRMMIPTTEEEYPVLKMAAEIGYDPRHYSEDELEKLIDEAMEPYLKIWRERQRTKRSRS
jgi:hypothetical protein